MVLNSEMWAFVGLCREVCHKLPLEGTLPEHQPIIARFRNEVANFPIEFDGQDIQEIREKVCKEIERILKAEYQDPLTILEVREVLQRVLYCREV